MENKTAVEWLAAKYNHVTWMRNRDEISSEMADKWRKHYLDQAKQMEKDQIIQAFDVGCEDKNRIGTEYYRDTYEN